MRFFFMSIWFEIQDPLCILFSKKDWDQNIFTEWLPTAPSSENCLKEIESDFSS